jgi:hypothetical protein
MDYITLLASTPMLVFSFVRHLLSILIVSDEEPKELAASD